MAETIVRLPIDYFPDPTIGRPIANGSIYIGAADTDPEVLGNRIPVTLRQEDGTEVPILPTGQPLVTSSGGVIEYNGSPVQVLTSGNYSIKVLSKQGSQEYYVENAFDGTPVTIDQVVLKKDTLADAVAAGDIYEGAALNIAERTTGNGGGAMWDVVLSSTVTENTFDIVQCTGVGTLSLVLRIGHQIESIPLGVIGDNSTDDQPAMERGNELARASGKTFVVTPTVDGHLLSSKFDVTANFDAKGCNFYMPGSLPVAIEVHDGVGSNAVFSLKTVNLPTLFNTTKPGTGWAFQGIGFQLRNVDASVIRVDAAVDFFIGLNITATSAGTSYNKITIGRLVNNEINLRLKPDDAPGFVNQNQIITGRCGFFETGGVAHIQLLPFGYGDGIVYNAPNSNHFLTTSIEGGNPNRHLAIGGQFNYFENVRFEEDAGVPKIDFVGDTVVAGLCKNNVISGGYHVGDADFTNQLGSLDSLNRQNLSNFGDFNATALSQGIYTANFSGGTAVHYAGFVGTKDILNATDADTDYVWRITEDFIQKKNAADAVERVRIGAEGIRIGNGVTAITSMPLIVNVFGSPEGGTTAPPGSLALNYNGGAGISIYGKDTGTGNTGWRAL